MRFLSQHYSSKNVSPSCHTTSRAKSCLCSEEIIRERDKDLKKEEQALKRTLDTPVPLTGLDHNSVRNALKIRFR